MAGAGREIRECYRVLAKTDDNIVGEALRDQATFYQWTHYPLNDVYDHITHAQFYYHAHPAGARPWPEHGHFHTFLRPRGMPRGVKPADVPPPAEPAETPADKEPVPPDNAALSHLVAISMNPVGLPIRLFTTNRWVTGETWYSAADVCAMLDCFIVDHTRPSWALNRWITAMFRLFKPQMAALLQARDRTVADWARQNGTLVYEDRSRDETSTIEIDVDEQIARVEAALARIARLPRNLSPSANEGSDEGHLAGAVGPVPLHRGAPRDAAGRRLRDSEGDG